MGDLAKKFSENVELPDSWFDWYARLLPGCGGVFLYFALSNKIPTTVGPTEFFLFVFVGYLIGHVIQPLSGFIVNRIEQPITDENRYAGAKTNDQVPASLTRNVSKAHAEANSMCSCGLITAAIAVLLWNSRECPGCCWWCIGGLTVYFFAATIERAFARRRKINDLPPVE